MREAGVAEKLPGLLIVVFMDQNPARQNAKRPFNDAHILVKHQVMDIGAVEQRSNRRNQHDVVGPNQFPHLAFSFIPARLTTCCCLAVLPRKPALSMVISEDMAD
jgi:hypothetical protein